MDSCKKSSPPGKERFDRGTPPTGKLTVALPPHEAWRLFTPARRKAMGGRLGRSAGNQSEVTVTYDLVALSDAGQQHLHTFAAGYPDFLMSWQTAIATVC